MAHDEGPPQKPAMKINAQNPVALGYYEIKRNGLTMSGFCQTFFLLTWIRHRLPAQLEHGMPKGRQ